MYVRLLSMFQGVGPHLKPYKKHTDCRIDGKEFDQFDKPTCASNSVEAWKKITLICLVARAGGPQKMLIGTDFQVFACKCSLHCKIGCHPR